MRRGSITLLGTGNSAGIPQIGCFCDVCKSDSPFDHRLRPSALITLETRSFLIDAGPDFRLQALRHHINHIDGLLITHTHFDHIAGIDDLRAITLKQRHPLPCLLSTSSFQKLQQYYPYLFSASRNVVQLEFYPFAQEYGCTSFCDLDIAVVSYWQSSHCLVNGFRIGNMAYLTDIRSFSPSLITALKGVENVIIGAAGSQPTRFHFSFQEAVSLSKQLKSKRVWLTHLSHQTCHERDNKLLPKNVELGFDGITIPFLL